MDTNKSYQIIRVAKKYYELHMGQLEIAQEEGVSKSTISRMLQKVIDLGYVKVTIDDYSNYPNVSKKDLYLNLKDSSKVYVVYNLLSDADSSDGISDSELDKHSGVILFQAKYSPYKSPTVGCWYGVKFQFLTKDGEIPTSVNKDSVFSDTKIYIEAAYEETGAYNNITSLDDAVEKFGFNNTDCFSTSNWTASSSGADKTGRAVSSVVVPTKNVFSKVE